MMIGVILGTNAITFGVLLAYVLLMRPKRYITSLSILLLSLLFSLILLFILFPLPAQQTGFISIDKNGNGILLSYEGSTKIYSLHANATQTTTYLLFGSPCIISHNTVQFQFLTLSTVTVNGKILPASLSGGYYYLPVQKDGTLMIGNRVFTFTKSALLFSHFLSVVFSWALFIFIISLVAFFSTALLISTITTPSQVIDDDESEE